MKMCLGRLVMCPCMTAILKMAGLYKEYIISGGPNGGTTHGGHLRCGGTSEGGPGGGPTHTGQTDDGGICEGGPSGTAMGGMPCGGPTYGGMNGSVYRRSLEILSGNQIRHTTRPEMHMPGENRYSSSVDSGEAMRYHVLERTIRRLEKQLTTMCSMYCKQLVDGSLVAMCARYAADSNVLYGGRGK